MSANNLIDVANPIRKTAETAIRLPVIFIGAIEGFIASGLVGLFTGAVIFSVGYKLFQFWLEEKEAEIENT